MINADVNPTVLIVDDLASTRMLVADMLREMGFTSVIEASNGSEALKKLDQDRPDLVVCDYVMRGMSGLDVIRELRKNSEFRRVPVIMLSNNRDVPLIDEAINAGADDYIVKPVSFHVLKRRIIDVMSRGEPVTAA